MTPPDTPRHTGPVKPPSCSDAKRSPDAGRTDDRDKLRPVEALFQEWKRTRDPELRERLIHQHLNLVRFLARKFASKGEPLEDLIQVGTVGLINAVDRFDPERGVRFATYATPTVVGEIKRYFRDHGWAIKVPRHLQELNLAANKAMENLTHTLDRSPTVKEIAAAISASEEETLEALELGHLYEPVSLEREMGSDETETEVTLSDYLGQEDISLERLALKQRLEQAVNRLSERERSIIDLRFYRGLPQTEVAKRLGISQMHVSRLQNRALARLRQMIAKEDL